MLKFQESTSTSWVGTCSKNVYEALDASSLPKECVFIWTRPVADICCCFDRIQEMYEAYNVQDRLQNLIEGMLKGDKKAPKIRCSAAQCQALVPTCKALAHDRLDAAITKHQYRLGWTKSLRQQFLEHKWLRIHDT